MNYQMVLTKADEVKAADSAERIEATSAALKKHPAAFPDVLATSSRTGLGMPNCARRSRGCARSARVPN